VIGSLKGIEGIAAAAKGAEGLVGVLCYPRLVEIRVHGSIDP
jgi:hypothetical protein